MVPKTEIQGAEVKISPKRMLIMKVMLQIHKSVVSYWK